MKSVRLVEPDDYVLSEKLEELTRKTKVLEKRFADHEVLKMLLEVAKGTLGEEPQRLFGKALLLFNAWRDEWLKIWPSLGVGVYQVFSFPLSDFCDCSLRSIWLKPKIYEVDSDSLMFKLIRLFIFCPSGLGVTNEDDAFLSINEENEVVVLVRKK